MADRLESEIQLLELYLEEFKKHRFESDSERKRQIYVKQIEFVKSQFPDDDAWKIHQANLYHEMAIIKGADKKWKEAQNLVDQAIGIYDLPRHRLLKAKMFKTIGQYPQSIAELEYIIANFPESDFYIDARQMKDEIESQPKGGCFVATAAYGSPLASEVVLLSRYRDKVLLPSKLGAVFVAFYYRVSPPLSFLIARVGFLRAATRGLLVAPLLRLLKASKFK